MGLHCGNMSIDKYLYGYIYIELFHLAGKYGVFNYLVEHNGASIEELSSELELKEEALKRILINLAAIDIVSIDEQIFTISPEYCDLFNARSDGFIGHYIQFIRNQGRAALQGLEGLLTGVTQEASPYQTLYNSPSDTTDFTEAMWELTYSTGKALADFLPPLPPGIVDIGGGSGALAIALFETGCISDITIFDLPAVQADFTHKAIKHQCSDQVSFLAGDFFTDPLPPAATYFLSYVLSNWSESDILRLLRRIHQQLAINGRTLIIFERLFEHNGVAPVSTAIMHLNMLLHTEGGHRSAHDYHRLLHLSGFSSVEVITTPFDKQLLIATI